MRECCPVFVGREKANLAPVLLDQFYWTNLYWTNLAPVLLTLSVLLTLPLILALLSPKPLDPSLCSLHLLDGSIQFSSGTNPPLADPAENREQADDGQQVNCNHFLRLLFNLFCSLRTSTQSSCRIHSGRDNRTLLSRAICMVVFFNLRA